MRDIEELVDGYHRFLDNRYPDDSTVYRDLAENGQSPHSMVIACSDSRVDPAAIFSAGPGQLFVVRNVANLVPPFEPEGAYHGTSAALEFAVTGLKVDNIVVMGHGHCGGVKAFLDGVYDHDTGQSFISRWISLLRPAYATIDTEKADDGPAARQREMEYAGVRHSLENLKTFPFVQDRLAAGDLRLRGAFFDIADGRLWPSTLKPVASRHSAATVANNRALPWQAGMNSAKMASR